MNDQDLRDYLATLTVDQVIEITIALNADAMRLRAELDAKDGVVR